MVLIDCLQETVKTASLRGRIGNLSTSAIECLLSIQCIHCLGLP